MGHEIVKTPHLDQLARDSVVFEQCYCASPMCVPSRASIATGRYPLSHGALDNALSPMEGEASLFDSFRQGGYETQTTGKWHTNGPADTWGGWNHHLDQWDGPAQNISCFGIAEPELRRRSQYKKNEGLLSLIIHGTSPLQDQETTDTLATKHYLDLIQAMSNSTKPHFLRLSLLDPHSPYLPIASFKDRYPHHDMPLPPSWNDSYENKPSLPDFFHKARGFHHLSKEDYQRSISSYLALVEHNDQRIGRVLQKLKEHKLYDDAIVVFTSDHGAMMGEQGCIEKWGHLYEPVTKIPLLIKFPQQKWAGRRSDTLVENVDILPSLMDFCQWPIPDAVQGKSLLPYLKGDCQEHKAYAFSSYMSSGIMDTPAWMVRHRDYKLTRYPSTEALQQALPVDHHLLNSEFFDREAPLGELYNLQNDPFERDNLWGRSEHRGIQEQLSRALDEHIKAQDNKADLSSLGCAPSPWGQFRALLEGRLSGELSSGFNAKIQAGPRRFQREKT